MIKNIPNLSWGVLDKSYDIIIDIKKGSNNNVDVFDREYGQDSIHIREKWQKLKKFIFSCEWIKIDELENVVISDTLIGYLDDSEMNIKRYLIFSFIEKWNPSWLEKIWKGTDNLMALDPSIHQILDHLNLLKADLDNNGKNWWHKINIKYYLDRQEKLSEIGRIGERLTLAYEENRIGRTPLNVSLKSDRYGYDIESWKSKKYNDKLLIEVKTSKIGKQGKLYLTSHEIKVCMNNIDRYIFYLWDIHNKETPRILKIPGNKIVEHVPKNEKKGEWEIFSIKFSVFDWDNAEEFYDGTINYK